MKHRVLVTSLLLLLAAGAGCALNTRRIADIQQYPGRFTHRAVSIEGTVTSSFGGPFLPVQAYRIDDGSGQIVVISNGARVPPAGARVRVRGRVEEVASFGSRSIGLHVQQEHLSVRRW